MKGSTPITTLNIGPGTGTSVITASFKNSAGDTITPAADSITWTPAAEYEKVVTVSTSGATASITPATTETATTSISVKYENNGNVIEGTLPIVVGANGRVVFVGLTNGALSLTVGGDKKTVNVTFLDTDGSVVPTDGTITWTPATSTYFDRTLSTSGSAATFEGLSSTAGLQNAPRLHTRIRLATIYTEQRFLIRSLST